MDLKSLISDLEDIKREIEKGSPSDAVESLQNVINEITIINNRIEKLSYREVTTKLIFTKDRIEEVQSLEKLLSTTSSLNNGNKFIEKVQAIIEIAEQLSKTDLRTPRDSFIEFLRKIVMNSKNQYIG